MSSPKKLAGQVISWIAYPAIYLILHNSHRTRVVIYSGEKVLFVKNWLGSNVLNLPGGGIKSGESSKQAAIREIREETGLEIDPSLLIDVAKDLSLSETGIRYIADCYTIELPKTVATSSKQLEIMESVWLPYREYLDTKQLSKNTNQLIHTWLSMLHLVD